MNLIAEQMASSASQDDAEQDDIDRVEILHMVDIFWKILHGNAVALD